MNAEAIRSALAEDFRAKRSTLESVDVPELGEGVKLYFYRRVDVRTMEMLAPYITPGMESFNIVTANLIAFVMCACDEDGKRIYSAQAIDEIRRGKVGIDIDLVCTVVDRMGVLRGEDHPNLEAEVKKPLKVETSEGSSTGESPTLQSASG